MLCDVRADPREVDAAGPEAPREDRPHRHRDARTRRRPGIEKVKTDAAPRSAITPIDRVGRRGLAVLVLPAGGQVEHDPKRKDEHRHRGFLEAGLGEERGPEVRQAGKQGGDQPASQVRGARGATAPRARSAPGSRSSMPLKTSRRLIPVPSDTLAASAWGPTGIADANRARLGPEPVREPVRPVELRGLVVRVDALAEDACALVEEERKAGEREHERHHARAQPCAGRGARRRHARRAVAAREPPLASHDRADDRENREEDRGSEPPAGQAYERTGAITTRAAKPTAPATHSGRFQPRASMSALPMTTEETNDEEGRDDAFRASVPLRLRFRWCRAGGWFAKGSLFTESPLSSASERSGRSPQASGSSSESTLKTLTGPSRRTSEAPGSSRVQSASLVSVRPLGL